MVTTFETDAEALDHEVAELVRGRMHVDDPYGLYARLRDRDPVFYCHELGIWLITGYAECGDFLRHPAVTREERHSSRYDPNGRRRGPVWDLIDTWMMWRDPPDHTRLRRAMTQMFAVRHVNAVRPAVKATVDGLLEGLMERGSMDLLKDFAVQVPSTVLYNMLGVSRELQTTIESYINSILHVLVPSGDGGTEVTVSDETLDQLRAYLREIIDDRRSHPRDDDLISHVIEDSGTLTEDELFGNIVFVVAAGGSSAGYTLANGIVGILRQPGQWDRLRADPGLVPLAAEEVLRWDGSNRNAIARWTTADIAVGGHHIAKGDEVWAVLGAADHDPRVFAAPEVFDVGRSPNPHIAFSLGNHACLGAHLARVEIQAALEGMIRCLPDLHLSSNDLHWVPNFLLRHLTSLPVAWTPEPVDA